MISSFRSLLSRIAAADASTPMASMLSARISAKFRSGSVSNRKTDSKEASWCPDDRNAGSDLSLKKSDS